MQTYLPYLFACKPYNQTIISPEKESFPSAAIRDKSSEMATEEIKSTPKPRNPSKASVSIENGGNRDTMFSPRFRSAAAMAGWDEEALLLAAIVVEDTPERESKQKKKINLHFKTPPVSSRRKRRVHRQSPSSKIPIVVLNLDEEETVVKEKDRKKMEPPTSVAKNKEKEKEGRNALPDQNSSCDSSLPCIDRLKEELSCAICLDICFEPSTTPCGHSFCKQCLKSAADKCGKKCPKCRQLISNGRYCTVNTVLWNTIQLLFPQEVEAKKASRATNSSPECKPCPSARKVIENLRNRSPLSPVLPLSRQLSARRRRAAVPSQSEDAALALRLQREEFMETFRGGSNDEQPRAAPAAAPAISSARANLRAMASRAMNLRIREQFR